jgi:hypothetical protein
MELKGLTQSDFAKELGGRSFFYNRNLMNFGRKYPFPFFGDLEGIVSI